MQTLSFGNPDWLATFPCRVAPSPDEWLVSLLLRCDEVNVWESGETFRYLLRSTNPLRFRPEASLLVMPFAMIECLAQLLMLSSPCLLATTYETELARLYPCGNTHPGQLLGLQYNPENWEWRRRLGQREIATERKELHICPACLAQTQTLKRTGTLPHLQSCPIHHVEFQERCPCGMPLTFFRKGGQPFQCFRCGLDWARWPQIEIPNARRAFERDIFALYELFLLKGTPELKRLALRLARDRLKEAELKLKLSGKTMKNAAKRLGGQFSLSYLVDILVSVGVSPNDLTQM
jgi:hypothetical protein